jgi:hypothetical protein
MIAINQELMHLRRLLLRTFTRIPAARTAALIPASMTSTQTAGQIVVMIATMTADPTVGVTAVIGVIAATGATAAVISEEIPVTTGDMIDLKWAKIDNEWVIYQSELDEWVRTNGRPYCPVCKGTKGVKNTRKEGNIKRGECASCGARLAIIKG